MLQAVKTFYALTLALAVSLGVPATDTELAAKSPQRVVETVEEQERPVPVIVAAPEPIYDQSDVEMLAKVLWLEARGVPSDTEKACVVWTVLNRVDAGYGSTIEAIVTAPNQFAYAPGAPVDLQLAELAQDVLDRWSSEKQGEFDVGRVLPEDYLWYTGDGKHNWFRDAYRNGTRWDYTLDSPYIT